MSVHSSRSAAELLRNLFEATAHATGDAFFKAFVRELAAALEASRASRSASERLSGIVENLQKFTRLDRAPLEKVDLREGVESVLRLLEPSIGSRIRIVRELGEIPPVLCRLSELNQAFRTILENACEAVQGEGTVTISTFADEESLSVRIADDGKGLTEREIDKLFEVGFGRKGSRVGVRLGLPTAWHLVERHGGSIHVTSRPGRGTAFTIRLPRADSGFS